ncbi:hypothetical protein ACH5RR_015069 [Cinchona calisaya]|uniref:Cystatin domain-containing protein n=1 Tax=Cinchona calisaya TaxID=153742 RepID=A0ABD2ZV70_9GENT
MALHLRPLLLTMMVFFLCSNALLFFPWKKENAEDPRVIELGKFAIDVHNKEAKTNLLFQRVATAESQLGGIKYKLLIAAATNDSSNSDNYEALIIERQRARIKYTKLVSFKEITRNLPLKGQ